MKRKIGPRSVTLGDTAGSSLCCAQIYIVKILSTQYSLDYQSMKIRKRVTAIHPRVEQSHASCPACPVASTYRASGRVCRVVMYMVKSRCSGPNAYWYLAVVHLKNSWFNQTNLAFKKQGTVFFVFVKGLKKYRKVLKKYEKVLKSRGFGF